MLRLLFLGLPVTIVVFILFFMGAKKAQKNRFLWGVLGSLSFLIPFLVLRPITTSMAVSSAREMGEDAFPGLFWSFYAITIAVGVFVAILVYKKILLKSSQLTVDQNAHVFCSECGTQCTANTAFCNKCGCKIGGI